MGAGLAALVGRIEVWGTGLVAGLGLLLLAELAPDVRATLPAAAIHAERGLAYVTPLPPLARFPYLVRGSQVYTPAVGRLVLLEDGFPAGRGDTLHETIRQEGGGRYSLWGQAVYLSASDGSDPRTNGRVYALVGRAALDPGLKALAIALLGVAGLGWGVTVARGPEAGRPGAVTLAGRAAAGLGALGLLGCLAATLLAPSRTVTLDPSAIARGRQLAYQASIPRPPGGLWRALLEDGDREATLREADADLGPIEADPSRVAGEGAGRYWFHGARLVFSTSDGTDPRAGDRLYSWRVPVRVRDGAWLASLALLLAGAAVGFAGRTRSALAWLGGHGERAPPVRLAFVMRWGPPGDRLCDAVIVAFALWTVCAHVIVGAGGGLHHLVWLFGLAAPLLGAGLIRWRPPAHPGAPGLAPGAAPGAARSRRAGRPGLRIAPGPWRAGVLAAALVVVAGFAWWGDPLWLWWSVVALLAVGLITTAVADEPRVRPAPARWAAERVLWLLAVACVVVALVAHRPDADDAFYVNVAVAAADAPRRALFGGDTLHGIPGLPLHLPVYRVHSNDLLNGAVSYLTGIPAIYVVHWLSAAAGALLVPLAHARLFRLLLPGHWLGAVAVLTAVLVVAGDVNHWYGNLAFVRIWQGKPLFLVVVLPLIQAYALSFVARPTLRGWLLLAAAQVAAVGCTSTALWAGPAAALLALACALDRSPRALATLALGALASTYVVAVGWLVRRDLGGLLEASIQARVPGPGARPGALWLDALVTMLGDYRLLLFGIGSLVAAWALAPSGLARRFAVVAPLGAVLGALNPYGVSWVTAHLSGPTYWRTMWLVPLPILMTLVLTAPLHLGARWRSPWRVVASLFLLAAFALLVPRHFGLGPGNSVRLAWPGLKVPPVQYRWAARVNESVPPGSVVAVPPDVAYLVATFHHHAYPLAVRGYLGMRWDLVGLDSVRHRYQLQDWVARPADVELRPQRFREGLDRFAVRAVCLARSSRAGVAKTVLQQAGFQRTLGDQDYELWVRPRAGARPPGGPR